MKEKSLFGLWSDFKASDINRLLRSHNVRLVVKKSKDWGDKVTVTAHRVSEIAEAGRVQTPDTETSKPLVNAASAIVGNERPSPVGAQEPPAPASAPVQS